MPTSRHPQKRCPSSPGPARPRPLVAPGDRPRRRTPRPAAHPACPHHRLVMLATRPPSQCTTFASEATNATVMLDVWLRNVIGIRHVGRSWRTPGGSTASGARPVQEGRPDARDPPQRPHHPGGPCRGRPLRRAPAVRAETPRSAEPTGELARRYGVSTETVRKWRKRGPAECRDRSSRPHKLPWKASEEERAVVRALRRATGFPLDDLTFVVRHFLPHLDRDHVYRILKAAGLSRRPAPARPERAAAKFKEYELGFVHLDVKHLPKLRTADGAWRKRFLFVAIDRRSRSVHLAVKDDETEASARAFLEEALAAFPFRVTHVLTDRGSCFTAEGFERACRRLGVEHRKTRPYTPRTNGMAERFNGRVQREVLGITVAGHHDLERLLAGFSSAYNARRQRVLGGRSPEEAVREGLARDRSLANPAYRPPADACVLPKAMLVIERAKDVSQPDS